MTEVPNPDPAPQLEVFRLEDSLGYIIARIKGRMSATLDEDLAGLDITHAQWVVMMHIANGSTPTCADLARFQGQDTGAMTRMLDRLEEKQLIARERSTDDRRVVVIRLTPQGEALYPQLRVVGKRLIARMTEGFGPEEVEVFRGMLRRVLSNLGSTEITS